MMPTKYPYIPLNKSDWLKDPKLSMCAPATRGVWIDLLCAMHDDGRSGELRGTAEHLARLARCSTADIVQALTDIQATGAAEVSERNGVYHVRNRRMLRESDTRKAHADRQKRYREKGRDGPVAPLFANHPLCIKGAQEEFLLAAAELLLPDSMECELVRYALLEWLCYKDQRGEKYKNPSFLESKVKQFVGKGPEALVAAIHNAIGNNYAGIYPMKDFDSNKPKQPRRSLADL